MVRKIDRLPELAPRRPDAHKGDFGHVLVVACSAGLTGAGCLAALAAQRAGAGLVTLALPAGLNAIAETKLTSAMSWPLPEPAGAHVLGREAADAVMERAAQFDVVALGPGLGTSDQTVEAVQRLAAELPAPVVLDADGLNALAGSAQILDSTAGPRILTPHPGEMARLAGLRAAGDVQTDRVGIAMEFAGQHGVLLGLKGAGTVVTDGERVFVNPTGNPGMATGGTGDVLTGLAAGLVAQGLNAFDALVMAVFVHGLAGDLAAAAQGELSLVAEDVLAQVAQAFLRIGRGGQPLDDRTLEALRG